MSESQEGTAPEVSQEEQPTKPNKKVFHRNDIKRYVEVKVNLPRLYPDYAPWVFKLRLKLSGEAEERRQQFLGLSAVKQVEQTGVQALDEICDLLLELPEGFGDLLSDNKSPGTSFKTYVETCPDANAKTLLYTIVEGASNLYWTSIMPREFRDEVQGRG